MVNIKTLHPWDQNVEQSGRITGLHGFRPAAIVFLGPPGSGKGTQAQQIACHYSLPYISPGDIFRAHVANKTPLGLQVAETIRSGMLVTDDLVCGMVAEHIRRFDYSGCLVLDGFPRSVSQAEWLDQFFRVERADSNDLPGSFVFAIQVNVAHSELIRRLSGRRSCPTCGQSYNLYFQPPTHAGICDYDGAELITREDDFENVVRERLIVYEQNSLPLTEYYRRKGRIREIDGNGTVDTVRTTVAKVTDMLTI